MKRRDSLETLGHWLDMNNKTKDGHLLRHIDMTSLYDQIHIITKCNKQSIVILLDVTTFDVRDINE